MALQFMGPVRRVSRQLSLGAGLHGRCAADVELVGAPHAAARFLARDGSLEIELLEAGVHRDHALARAGFQDGVDVVGLPLAG